MVTTIHNQAAEHVLAAMWQTPGKGYPSMFGIRKPGQPHGFGGISTTIFFSRRELVRACLYIRKNGPPFLGYISVSDIWSLVTSFVTDNYWRISGETFLSRYEGSYADHLSDDGKTRFAEAIADSPIFAPVNEPTLFCLIPIKVTTGFTSPAFFLRPSADLVEEIQPRLQRYLLSDQFPPFQEMKLKTEATSAWLGVRAPNRHVAQKMRAVVLGALALTPNYRERHMFSGRHMFGGSCVVKDEVSVSFGRGHAPAMMHDIVVIITGKTLAS